MPVWLQLTAAVSAALASGIMGAAFVPFLQKMRFCEPDTPPDKEQESAEHRLRPTMCGLLLVFGCMTALALSCALYRGFCVLDSTSVSAQNETKGMLLCASYALFSAAAGFAADWRIVRRLPLWKFPKSVQILGIFLMTAVFRLLCGMESTVLDFGFWRYDAGWLYVPLTAAAGTVLWTAASGIEEQTDGVCISTGGVLLLGAAVLCIQEQFPFHALLSLSAAGACMGCLVWNLHPAKCRLGKTGIFWMCGIVTALSLQHGNCTALLLTAAVYLLNRIPAWRKQGCTLQAQMRDAGMKHWTQIAVFAGFAAFCSILAVI